MIKHKFKAGQRVTVGGSRRQSAPRGRYRVISALPLSAGPIRYRIKGDVEQFERIVDEAELQTEEF